MARLWVVTPGDGASRPTPPAPPNPAPPITDKPEPEAEAPSSELKERPNIEIVLDGHIEVDGKTVGQKKSK